MTLPPPDPSGRLAVDPPELQRILLFVRPGTPPAETDRAAWIAAASALPSPDNGVIASRAGFHGEYSFLPDHLTWDVASRAPLDPTTLLARLPGPADLVEAVRLGAVLDAGIRSAGGGTKRTILMRARAGTDAPRLAAFEQALADTPLYITAIDNWRLSRVASSTGPVGWTHCFEQEVPDASIFVGDYLDHPYHWSVVERLFHPDAPDRIGDAFLHTLYPIDRSVLAEIT